MSLVVVEAAGLITVQDRGRIGWAHLGVPRAGALDGDAASLANRLVGNTSDDAVLEVTLGRLAFRVGSGRWFAVTGARSVVLLDGLPQAFATAVYAPQGALVEIDRPDEGARAFLAVAGGIAVQPVLGSRSTDTLAGIGPEAVTTGAVLPLGGSAAEPRSYDTPRVRSSGAVRVWPGPRVDWFVGDALERLCQQPYVVSPDSNRIGVRLRGVALERSRTGELASEGMVLGAIQVPPDGQPVALMHDHPVTGGYPVLAVIDERDLGLLAQARPGDEVRFARAR
jgi:biotin-dependent carboxylase-like uncharacterized protein